MAICWDIYEKVGLIVRRLDELGQVEWKSRVESGLYGSTSGECLMLIEGRLEALIKARLPLLAGDLRLIRRTRRLTWRVSRLGF